MAKLLVYLTFFFLIIVTCLAPSKGTLRESELPKPQFFQAPMEPCPESSSGTKNFWCDMLDRFHRLSQEDQCRIDATHRKLICDVNSSPKGGIPKEVWVSLCIQAVVGPFSHCSS